MASDPDPAPAHGHSDPAPAHGPSEARALASAPPDLSTPASAPAAPTPPTAADTADASPATEPPTSFATDSPRALARAATQIENRTPEARALLQSLYPQTGRALVVGLTGAPGAGKSTIAGALIAEWRARDKRVAVLAVDPTSPFTGGAILGDRIRMMQHHADPGVFIRSMATRGRLGGLAAATADLTLLYDAAGFDIVLVETVGVGQDEIDIARLAGVTVVVLVPGMGDSIQAIKAGILEIADVYVINKSDRDGAAQLEQELHAEAPHVPIVRTIAHESRGIPELAAAIEAHQPTNTRRVQLWKWRLREMLLDRLSSRITEAQLQSAAESVALHHADPYAIVDAWVG